MRRFEAVSWLERLEPQFIENIIKLKKLMEPFSHYWSEVSNLYRTIYRTDDLGRYHRLSGLNHDRVNCLVERFEQLWVKCFGINYRFHVFEPLSLS